MMLLEGFIAMIWAAAAMGIYNAGLEADLIGKPAVIGLVARDLLGSVGGMIAIIGVIVLPLTSGDTALRSLRLMVADHFNIDQKPKKNRIMVSSVIFALTAGILIFAKLSTEGFNVLWRYFAWSNQTIAVFAFAIMVVYLMKEGKNYLVALIPGAFYMFVISSYILNAPIGFHLSFNLAYIIAGILTAGYIAIVYRTGLKAKSSLGSIPVK